MDVIIAQLGIGICKSAKNLRTIRCRAQAEGLLHGDKAADG